MEEQPFTSTRPFIRYHFYYTGFILFSFILFLFSYIPIAFSAQVTLAWDKPNDERVTGFYIYYGLSDTEYKSSPNITINSSDQTSYVISDLEEGRIYSFSATSFDEDGQESSFSEEMSYYVPIAIIDNDGDGLSDSDEINIYGSNPDIADTDNDGMNDSEELAFWGSDWDQDVDNDSLINLLDEDSDNDGYSDGVEVTAGSKPDDEDSNPETLENTFEYIEIEAENGFICAPMEIFRDEEASAGEYIEVPPGNGDLNEALADSGYAEYDFDILETGNYVIWCKILAAGSGNDSFFISIDNGEPIPWHILNSETWEWDIVSDREASEETRDYSNPVIYNMDQGEHTLSVIQREDGTKLDKIIITNDLDYVPVSNEAAEIIEIDSGEASCFIGVVKEFSEDSEYSNRSLESREAGNCKILKNMDTLMEKISLFFSHQ